MWKTDRPVGSVNHARYWCSTIRPIFLLHLTRYIDVPQRASTCCASLCRSTIIVYHTHRPDDNHLVCRVSLVSRESPWRPCCTILVAAAVRHMRMPTKELAWMSVLVFQFQE